MSELKRKRGESFEGFIRRTKRQWQRSGKLIQAKKIQYFTPKKSKGLKNKNAVERVKQMSKDNYLRKIGKLPLEEDKFARKR